MLISAGDGGCQLADELLRLAVELETERGIAAETVGVPAAAPGHSREGLVVGGAAQPDGGLSGGETHVALCSPGAGGACVEDCQKVLGGRFEIFPATLDLGFLALSGEHHRWSIADSDGSRQARGGFECGPVDFPFCVRLGPRRKLDRLADLVSAWGRSLAEYHQAESGRVAEPDLDAATDHIERLRRFMRLSKEITEKYRGWRKISRSFDDVGMHNIRRGGVKDINKGSENPDTLQFPATSSD